jgi:hypothetical protein
MFYICSLYAFPNVNNPYKAITLRAVGRGFLLFKALGMEDPAKITEARRESSTP